MTIPRRNLARTLALFRAFLAEQEDPARLYGLMAHDVVQTLSRFVPVSGQVVLDVGGGPGYVAEALAMAGAWCLTVEREYAELHLHDRLPIDAVLGDGQQLPIRSTAVDIVHCSNVLEHVPHPRRLFDELVRVVRPGGVIYLSYTPWWSPWGGHELSPWHYLGAEQAIRRFEARGREIKNRPGVGLFRITVAEVLRWARTEPRVELLSVCPRYYPSWSRPIVSVPVLREVLTWNVELVLRRQQDDEAQLARTAST